MYRIKFMDKTAVDLSDDKAQRLQMAIKSNTQWVNINGNSYNTSTIMSIEKQGGVPDAQQPLLAAPTTELSDEQREKNIARIRKMREDFISRRQTKHPG